MRSKIARKLIGETPDSVRERVRASSNERIDAYKHCQNACDWPDCTLPKCVQLSSELFDIIMDHFEKDQTMNVQNAVGDVVNFLEKWQKKIKGK